MTQFAVALLAGTVFGLGLAVSGMIDAAVVLSFLDLTGEWNPALIFVMLGALAVSIPAFTLQKHFRRPWLAAQFDLPVKRAVDRNLVVGAGLFGVGWGLVGWCPGPAIASLAYGSDTAIVFVVSMVAGMSVAHLLWDLM